MRKLLSALPVLLFLMCGQSLFAQCSNTGYGAYTCVQSCAGHGVFATSATCAMGGNVTAGNVLYILTGQYMSTQTLTIGGCSNVTFSTPDSQVVVNTADSGQHAYGVVNTTGACSPTVTVASGSGVFTEIVAVEIQGSNNTLDGHGLKAIDNGTGSLSAPTVTTAVDGDLVLSSAVDVGVGGNTLTAGSGTILIYDGNYGQAIQGQVQSTHGSITPTITAGNSSHYALGTMAFEVGGSPPPATVVPRRR